MKFTKEDAIKDLVARFEAKDKDLDLRRTVTEHVENTLKLIGENEEMELSGFVDALEKILSSSVGLMRHQVSVAVKSKDAEIETLKKKVSEPTSSNNSNNEPDDSKMKSLLDRIQKLEEEREKNEKSRKISEKRAELVSKIKEGGVKNEDWINDTLAKVSISEDTDVDAEAKYHVDLFNKYFSDTPKNVTPKNARGGGSGAKNSVLEEIKARRKSTLYNPNPNENNEK